MVSRSQENEKGICGSPRQLVFQSSDNIYIHGFARLWTDIYGGEVQQIDTSQVEVVGFFLGSLNRMPENFFAVARDFQFHLARAIAAFMKRGLDFNFLQIFFEAELRPCR